MKKIKIKNKREMAKGRGYNILLKPKNIKEHTKYKKFKYISTPLKYTKQNRITNFGNLALP